MITKKMSLLLGTAMALAATPALADPIAPGGGGFASPAVTSIDAGISTTNCAAPNESGPVYNTDDAQVTGVDGSATVTTGFPGYSVTTTCFAATQSETFETTFFEETPGFFGFANDELEGGLVGQTPGQSAYVVVVEEGEATSTTVGIVTENQGFEDDDGDPDANPQPVGGPLSGAFVATAGAEVASFDYEVTGTSGPAAMYYTHTEVNDDNANDADAPEGVGSQTTNYQTSGGSSWSSSEGTSSFDPLTQEFDYTATSGTYAEQDVDGNTVGEWANNGVDPATMSETNQTSTGFSVTDGTDTVTLDQDGLSGTAGVTIDGGGPSYVQVNANDVTIHGGDTSTTVVVNNAGITVTDSTNGQTFAVDSSGNGTFAGNVSAVNGTLSGTLGVTGATTLGSTLDVAGLATLNGGLGVTGGTTTDTLLVTGATTTNGITNTGNIGTDTLSTTGAASVGGTLGVAGLTSTNGIANTGAISTDTLSTTGAATVGGTLGVTGLTTTAGITNVGALTQTGNVNVTGDVALLGATSDLTVGGLTTTNGIANTGAISTGTLSTTGNATVGGTLGVTGATTLSSTLAVAGNTTVGGTLGVTGATTLTGALTANGGIGTTTLTTSGNATIGGTLGVTGATTTNGITNTGAISTTTLSTTGAASVGTNLTVGGNTTLTGTLAVGGASTHTGLATFNGNIQAGTVVVNSTTNKISGLANATLSATSTEAVTGQQLFSTNTALSALDAREAAHYVELTAGIADTRRRAFQGVAMNMASNAAPLSLSNGEAGISGGVGVFEGEWGVAIRAAGVTSNGVGLGANVGLSEDAVGGAVGASIKF